MRNIALAAALPAFALPLLADWNGPAGNGEQPHCGCAPVEAMDVGPCLPAAAQPVLFARRHAGVKTVLAGQTYRYRSRSRICPRMTVPRPRLVRPPRRPPVVLRSPYGRSHFSPYCYSFKPPKRHRR